MNADDCKNLDEIEVKYFKKPKLFWHERSKNEISQILEKKTCQQTKCFSILLKLVINLTFFLFFVYFPVLLLKLTIFLLKNIVIPFLVKLW